MMKSYLNVKKIGELELLDVFAEYDHPLLFVCSDRFGSLYLIVETSDDENTTHWIASRITHNQYFDIVGERKSFESVFRDNSSSFIYEFIDRHNGEQIDCSLLDCLPNSSSFLGDTRVSELGYNPIYTQAGDSIIIEVEAFPDKDVHSVPVEMNKAVCDSIEKTVQGKFGKDYYLECDVPRAASYGFRFIVKSKNTLPFASNVEVSKTVVETITSNESVIKLENLNTVKGIAKLYKTLKKHKSEMIVNAIQKNSKCFYSKKISSNEVNRIEESISGFVKEEKKKKCIINSSIIAISGVLSAYDVRKKRFEIVSEKTIYSGGFAKEYDVKNQIVGLNSIYNAKIVVNSNGEKELIELIPQSGNTQSEFENLGNNNAQQ